MSDDRQDSRWNRGSHGDTRREWLGRQCARSRPESAARLRAEGGLHFARGHREGLGRCVWVDHAFHRFSDMAAHPDVDLLVVCVRVPGHRELVMAGLQAGKPVCCEWPLGKNLAEAEEMAALARQRSLKTIVGLQGRSDPTILYARDLIKEGYIGEVLTANLNTVAEAHLQRGPGRIWQGVRANGANVLTITGGHAIDALCAVLGEFAELSARVSTRIPEWRTLEGKAVPVDSPDSI